MIACVHVDGFTLKWIRRVTWEVRSNWRDLGIELKVDCGTLEVYTLYM